MLDVPPRVRRRIYPDYQLRKVCICLHITHHAHAQHNLRRCEAPTCPVCTRTCTAVPPTREPTPALSFSSSTSPPTPTPSPRRAALSLATNTTTNEATVHSARRRKHEDDSADMLVGKEMDTDGWTHGCGRVVCRACCTESIPRCDTLVTPRSYTVRLAD